MQGDTLDILRQRILFRRHLDARIAHDAGDERRLRQALLPDQPFEGPVAAPTGRDLEPAGLGALGIEDRPDVEALQESTPGNVLGQILDRDAGLQAPDVGLAEHKLVEGDVSRRAERDLLNGLCHDGYSATDDRETLSRPENPSRKPAQPSRSRLSLPADRGKMCSRFPLAQGGITEGEDALPSVNRRAASGGR